MPPRSPFEYDVSVSADKRRRQRLRGMSGAFETSAKCCDWPGCQARGQYRAPYAPDRLDDYRWFCLDHVRQYNQSWNFFADCSEDDIDSYLRQANAWERPTWRLGRGPGFGQKPIHSHAEGKAWERWGFTDPFEVLGQNATLNPAPGEDAPIRRRRLTGAEQRAMDTLGLPHRVENRIEVRARYRGLVKDLHPDMNGGENPDPDRLTRVIRAWEILKKSRSFKD